MSASVLTTENWPLTESRQDGKPERRAYQRDGQARPPLATMLFTAATGYQQESAGCTTRDKTFLLAFIIIKGMPASGSHAFTIGNGHQQSPQNAKPETRDYQIGRPAVLLASSH
jgi:hypothetical protein